MMPPVKPPPLTPPGWRVVPPPPLSPPGHMWEQLVDLEAEKVSVEVAGPGGTLLITTPPLAKLAKAAVEAAAATNPDEALGLYAMQGEPNEPGAKKTETPQKRVSVVEKAAQRARPHQYPYKQRAGAPSTPHQAESTVGSVAGASPVTPIDQGPQLLRATITHASSPMTPRSTGGREQFYGTQMRQEGEEEGEGGGQGRERRRRLAGSDVATDGGEGHGPVETHADRLRRMMVS